MNQSSGATNQPSVCFVHDWLVTMRGGEKVLEAFTEIFPDAPIYTLFVKKEALSPHLRKKVIRTSFLQLIPGISKFYRWLLPIFPLATRSLNLNQYDVVISISHCIAKSVKVRKGATHVCYCNSPMRYLWEFSDEYFNHLLPVVRWFIAGFFKWLKRWDFKTAQDVTHFIGNSANISSKIKKYYGRDAHTIHPAVDVDGSDEFKPGEYFISLGALVPYKRVDLAVEACNKLGQPLRVIGNGPSLTKLKRLATHPGIRFEGWLDDETIADRFRNAKALLFPGEEDFGIVPLEAQMFGKPVIAYAKGGVLETVVPCPGDARGQTGEGTGVFFHEQTVDAMIDAIKRFESLTFDPFVLRRHARGFKRHRLIEEFRAFLASRSIVVPALETC
jgi:glycosyltransferase involved in cell wall biosynthesis